MSKRLQEISRQALDYAFEICNQSGHANLNSSVALTLAMSKQAELIVRECIREIGYKSVDLLDIDFYPHYQERLKKHFGVEE